MFCNHKMYNNVAYRSRDLTVKHLLNNVIHIDFNDVFEAGTEPSLIQFCLSATKIAHFNHEMTTTDTFLSKLDIKYEPCLLRRSVLCIVMLTVISYIYLQVSHILCSIYDFTTLWHYSGDSKLDFRSFWVATNVWEGYGTG